MPSSAEILAGLRVLANEWWLVAAAWHVGLGLFLACVLLGWRPSKRLAAVLLATPLASVAAVAWWVGNPFNGTVFGLLAAGCVASAATLPKDAAGVGPASAVALGGGLVAFGWVYPHFLSDASWLTYLYAAPLGLIPCPTLSAVIGVALVFRGLESRPWSLMVAAVGVVYGIVGVLRLGVTIDVVLLGGAATLGVVATRRAGWIGTRDSGRTRR